jgi:hypothetical protein
MKNWFASIRREWVIRKALRLLSREYVIDAPAPPAAIVIVRDKRMETAEMRGALRTCYLRGWAEPIDDAPIPAVALGVGGNLQRAPGIVRYRLTSAGWNVVHNARRWLFATLFISFLGLLLTLLNLIINLANYLDRLAEVPSIPRP